MFKSAKYLVVWSTLIIFSTRGMHRRAEKAGIFFARGTIDLAAEGLRRRSRGRASCMRHAVRQLMVGMSVEIWSVCQVRSRWRL